MRIKLKIKALWDSQDNTELKNLGITVSEWEYDLKDIIIYDILYIHATEFDGKEMCRIYVGNEYVIVPYTVVEVEGMIDQCIF